LRSVNPLALEGEGGKRVVPASMDESFAPHPAAKRQGAVVR